MTIKGYFQCALQLKMCIYMCVCVFMLYASRLTDFSNRFSRLSFNIAKTSFMFSNRKA